jgi:hypothetical protein
LFRVETESLGRVNLVRVRNPWGDKNEWKGKDDNSKAPANENEPFQIVSQ